MTHDHPTAQVLAEFADGLLTPAATAEIEEHAASCGECRQTVVELGAVASQLHELPSEIAMPADVAARMTAAIERETDARASRAGDAGPVAAGPVAWFRRRLPQALVATSVVGLLVVFGSVLVNNMPSGGSGDAEVAGGDGGGTSLETTDEPLNLDQENPEAQQGPVEDMTRADLRAQIEQVWNDRSEFRPGCGEQLADEQAQTLVGSTELGTGVLIVLEDAGSLNGWVVPACASLSGQAVRDVLVVPTPAR